MKKVLFVIITIFVLACGSGGGSGDEAESFPTRLQNPVFENISPIGLSSFSLGVPDKFPFEDAQQTPEGIGFKTVARSVRHIATNELFNFPEPASKLQVEAYLKSFVDAGHIVTHEIHILNGPGMRKEGDEYVNAFYGKNIGDKKFVADLPHNAGLQEYIRKRFVEAVEHARVLESYGIQVLICPELEDNHDADTESKNAKLTSYGILIKFLTDAGWSRQSIVRNGGKIHAIPDIRYERHPGQPKDANSVLAGLRPGDVFNMDGVSFRFDDESGKECIYSEDQVRKIRDEAMNRGIIFYIWHSDLQGLYYNGCAYKHVPHRNNRIYTLVKPIRFISILLGIRPEEVVIE